MSHKLILPVGFGLVFDHKENHWNPQRLEQVTPAVIADTHKYMNYEMVLQYYVGTYKNNTSPERFISQLQTQKMLLNYNCVNKLDIYQLFLGKNKWIVK
jgi:hypothetical protein